ncbi:MAG: nucleoside-diphosphate sugar epimerase/dehydratase [Elusimicrobia bacterium]|nr:nucleoside-diphosphate sugar epimerase/dehydratase [Elusimicrobiota bacterium]
MTHQSLLKIYSTPEMTENGVVSRRRLAVVLGDLLVVLAAYTTAYLLRFDFAWEGYYSAVFIKTTPAVMLSYLMASYYFGLNRGLRHYASFGDILNVAKAAACAGMFQAAFIMFITQGRFPRSILLMAPMLTLGGVAMVHACVRYAKEFWQGRGTSDLPVRTAVIVGAGDLGELVYRQMRTEEDVNYRIVAFFDEDAEKWGMRLHGVQVAGGASKLAAFLGRTPVDEVVVAVSSARGQSVSAVAEALRELAKRPVIRIAPSLDEMLRSPSAGANPRKVQPADLLNRKEVRLDLARIARSIEGKTVLVTGAGGTIGGELCRQAIAYRPRTIVLIENHATALFYREKELREKMPSVTVVPVLGNVRDQNLLDRVFREHKPQVVFHAAAHKHVLQLESNVQEGVSNNTLGTYHLAAAADKHGVEVFLLISTDKAVRPSCVRGATKRAAEIVVTDFARRSKTRFVAVRFGNVLGSSGSVLKIFQEQIELGRPITITHPDVTRFFMTVEEAVGLVLQTGAMAKGGEVFVLKMGEPVRIMDMARNLILLSGLEPGRDVEIRITGLKTGEKMAEELVEDPAGEEQSEHPEIMVLRSENGRVENLAEKVLELELASRGTDKALMMRRLSEFVPTFTADAAHGDFAEIGDL